VATATSWERQQTFHPHSRLQQRFLHWQQQQAQWQDWTRMMLRRAQQTAQQRMVRRPSSLRQIPRPHRRRRSQQQRRLFPQQWHRALLFAAWHGERLWATL
jgi:hypothetical protein